MRWGAHAPGETVTRIMPDLPPDGALTADAMGAIMARLLPDNAILSDDSLTAGPGLQKHLAAAPAHDAIFSPAAPSAMPPHGGRRGHRLPDRKSSPSAATAPAMYSLQACGPWRAKNSIYW